LSNDRDEAGKAFLAGVVRQAVRMCAEAGEIPSAGELKEVVILSAANDRERKRKGDYSSNVAFKLLALHNQSAAAESETKEKGKERCKDGVNADDDNDGGNSERLLLQSDESPAGHERSAAAKRPRKENAKQTKNEKRKAGANQASAIASKLLAHVERALDDEETAARIKSHFGDEGVRAVVAGPWINFFVVASPHHNKPQAQELHAHKNPRHRDIDNREPPIPHHFEARTSPRIAIEQSTLAPPLADGPFLNRCDVQTELRPAQFTEESYHLYRKCAHIAPAATSERCM
jgi:hypothetical protein